MILELRKKLLHFILDLGTINEISPCSLLNEVIDGGADIVQLRAKKHSESDITTIIEKIKPIIIEKKILFLINDYVDLAMKYVEMFPVGMFGVHIGQDDMSIKEARKKLGYESIIGVTVNSVVQAKEAEQNSADYVGFGAIFPTTTKNDAVERSLDIAKDMRNAINIPIYLIGGIGLENLSTITDAGFDTVAVSSAIAHSDNPLKTTSEIKKKLLAVNYL